MFGIPIVQRVSSEQMNSQTQRYCIKYQQPNMKWLTPTRRRPVPFKGTLLGYLYIYLYY
ncbi:hypothetical protein C0J52_05830 [Blattella germanica]|nr:hypothetical protein C0J52_05830 [Blattella germanica]